MTELKGADHLYELARSGVSARYRYLEATAELMAWSDTARWALPDLAAVTALFCSRASIDQVPPAVTRYMVSRRLYVCQTQRATVPYVSLRAACEEARRMGLRPASSRIWYVRQGLRYAYQAVEFTAFAVPQEADRSTAAQIARAKAQPSGVRFLSSGYHATAPGDIWVAGAGDVAANTAWLAYGALEKWEQGGAVEGSKVGPLYRGLLGDQAAVPFDLSLLHALGVTHEAYRSAVRSELMRAGRCAVEEAARLLSGHGTRERVDSSARDLMTTIGHVQNARLFVAGLPGMPFDFPVPGRGDWTPFEAHAAIQHGVSVRRALGKRHPAPVVADMFTLPTVHELTVDPIKRHSWDRVA